MRLPFVVLPFSLLLHLDVPQVVVLTVFFALWNQVIHVNAPLSLGPLAYLVVDPRYHRVHHSTADVHRDRNFATYFPIWDVLFCTAYFPKKHEKIKTGLVDKHEPETIRHHLFGLASRASSK